MKNKNELSIKFSLVAFTLALIILSACASGERIRKKQPLSGVNKAGHAAKGTSKLRSAKPYVVMGKRYYPLADAYGYNKVGIASWYGPKFNGKPTASGETYDMDEMTAAHKTLPLQTMVEVTRLDTGKKIVLRVNDRGPFVDDRIIDLSRGGASRLDMIGGGTAKVRVVALAQGEPGPKGDSEPWLVEEAPDFTSGPFWVQVGAFGEKGNAERVRERLLVPQDMIRLQPVTRGDGLTLYRVQAGPYNDIRDAEQAILDFVNLGFERSFVMAGD